MSDGWTDARVERLKHLWERGLSCSEIARDLAGGITRSAVIGKAHRLKLSPRRGDAQLTIPKPAPKLSLPRPKPGKISSLSMTPAAERRNPTNNLAAKLALAEDDPGLPLLKSEKPDGTGIQLRELNELNCHWPKGDPREPDFEFCGAKALPGLPYCAHHARMSYAPPRERVRQDKWAFLGTDKLR